MRFWRIWSTVTVALVAVLGGWNIFQTARAAITRPQPSTDVVTLHEAGMAAIRRELVARDIRGVIGYVADERGGNIYRTFEGVQDFYLTQYALAPVILDVNADQHPWAVAKLRQATIDNLPVEFEVVVDAGSGVFLLQRRPR
jgi:hypothetical protein